MNAPLKIYFELDPAADVRATKAVLTSGLGQIEDVAEVEVQESAKRLTGVEVVAIVGAAVLIANSAKDALDALTSIIKSLKELAKEVKGLRQVVFETPVGPKTLEEVKAQDLI